MPIYEYECREGHRFELIQKFDADPPDGCSECGEVVQKLLSAPSFQFKGTGWYVTDYAKPSASKKSPSTDGDSLKDSPQKTSHPKPSGSSEPSHQKKESPQK